MATTTTYQVRVVKAPGRVRTVPLRGDGVERFTFPNIWFWEWHIDVRRGLFITFDPPDAKPIRVAHVCLGDADARYKRGELTAQEAFWNTEGHSGEWANYTDPDAGIASYEDMQSMFGRGVRVELTVVP